MDIKKTLESLQQQITQALERTSSAQELEDVRLKYFTRNSELSQLLSSLKDMSPEDKRHYGPLFNDLRKVTQELFEQTRTRVLAFEKTKTNTQNFDITAYKPNQLHRSLHPYTRIIQKIEDVAISMGYTIVQGPELEHEEVNFDALNVPAHHPARDMQDTLWLQLPSMLMRTHTSSVQIRTMRAGRPPFAIMTNGRAYRYEATDASHDYVFGQTELLFVDKKTSLANLLGTIQEYLASIFDRRDLQIRIQPTYYPFVEPGIDVHMQCVFCTSGCSVCKQSGWIEIGGAGMVHPSVLRACNIDPDEYQGFAFGFGLTRLTMLKYGINDIRLLNSGNLEFLTQF